jgi:hypothetical protein
VARKLGIVAPHLLDESFGVLAADEGLERSPSRKSGERASAFVVGNEHDDHHDRSDDSQKYRDAHEENQRRCCALTFLGYASETLHLANRMVDESIRLFPDLLGKQIRAVPVIRRRAHSLLVPVAACRYTPVYSTGEESIVGAGSVQPSRLRLPLLDPQVARELRIVTAKTNSP